MPHSLSPAARWRRIEDERLVSELTKDGWVVRGMRKLTPTQRRAQQEALRDALAEACQGDRPLPREMLEALWDAAVDVCRGHAPELFKCVGSGRPDHPGAEAARQMAGEYIAAAGDPDERKRRIRMVVKRFGVSPRSAMNWEKDAAPVRPDPWDVEDVTASPDAMLDAWAEVYRRHRPQVGKHSGG